MYFYACGVYEQGRASCSLRGMLEFFLRLVISIWMSVFDYSLLSMIVLEHDGLILVCVTFFDILDI